MMTSFSESVNAETEAQPRRRLRSPEITMTLSSRPRRWGCLRPRSRRSRQLRRSSAFVLDWNAASKNHDPSTMRMLDAVEFGARLGASTLSESVRLLKM